MRTAQDVLAMNGVRLATYAPGRHRAPCPRCEKSNDLGALSIWIDSGVTWVCWRCNWRGGVRGSTRCGERRKPSPTTPNDEQQRVARAYRIWRHAQRIDGTIGERYLRSRGIDLDPLPRCLRVGLVWHKQLKREALAMIAAVQDIRSNRLRAVHCTFIGPDARKLSDVEPRLVYGPVRGAAVKLTPDDQVEQGLAVAEGIETGLSIMSAGFPIWALISTSNLRAFEPLDGIEVLTIAADNDANHQGEIAAQLCAEHWAEHGVEVRISSPPRTGDDWNDHLARAAA